MSLTADLFRLVVFQMVEDEVYQFQEAEVESDQLLQFHRLYLVLQALQDHQVKALELLEKPTILFKIKNSLFICISL